MGASSAHLGASWRVLGASCRVLGASWGRLLAILCNLGPILSKTLGFQQNSQKKTINFNGFSKVAGAILAPSWLKKPSWELSWPSWQPSWTHFSSEGRLKSVLGPSWERLGRLLARLGCILARLRAILPRLGPILASQGRVRPVLHGDGKCQRKKSFKFKLEASYLDGVGIAFSM